MIEEVDVFQLEKPIVAGLMDTGGNLEVPAVVAEVVEVTEVLRDSDEFFHTFDALP